MNVWSRSEVKTPWSAPQQQSGTRPWTQMSYPPVSAPHESCRTHARMLGPCEHAMHMHVSTTHKHDVCMHASAFRPLQVRCVNLHEPASERDVRMDMREFHPPVGVPHPPTGPQLEKGWGLLE